MTLYSRDDPVYRAVLDALIRTPLAAIQRPDGQVSLDPHTFVSNMLAAAPDFAGIVRDGLVRADVDRLRHGFVGGADAEATSCYSECGLPMDDPIHDIRKEPDAEPA